MTHLVVGNGAVRLGGLGVAILLAAVIAEDGLGGGPLEHVVRLQRDLPAAARQIDRQVRHREAGRPPAQALQDLDPLGERGAQVLEPLGDVHLVEIVRPDAHGQALLHQVADGGHRGVQPAHQHRLVLHRDPVVDEPLARLARLGGDLLGVVEVRDHVERREPAQRAAQLVVDAHRQADRDAGADADDLDVRDGADALEQIEEPLRGKEQRVASGDEHVPHLRMRAQVRERFLQLLAGDAALVTAGDAPARAVPAVDAAVVEGEQEDAVGVLVDDGAHGPVQVLAERVAQLALVPGGFRAHGDGLHAHRAEGVRRVDQREVVRGDAQPEDAARVEAAALLVLAERHESLQVLERAHRMAQLPAPVAPLRVARLGEEALPARRGALHASGLEPTGAREDAARSGRRQAAKRARPPPSGGRSGRAAKAGAAGTYPMPGAYRPVYVRPVITP